MSGRPHRAGVAALLGLPNAGKSTLLNRLLGEKLAIVSPKPQTTRSRILGVLTLEHAQVLLQDTPGLHEGRKPLDAPMRRQVSEAAADCDVALVLVDLLRGLRDPLRSLCGELGARGTPLLFVGTKLDRPGARDAPWPPPEAGSDERGAEGDGRGAGGVERGAEGDEPRAENDGRGARDAAVRAVRVSAHTGEGLDALLDAIVARLPEGPPYYAEDELTDRPLRFLAAELVREAAFRALEQELPYRIAVEVTELDESRPDLVRIRANVLVERESQKPIVIGRGGETVKRIGSEARRDVERLLGTRVHLELWVKPEPRWTRPRRLESLGYV